MVRFVTKVRVAKEKGAHAVIIVDRENSDLTRKTIPNVLMGDDGYGDKIDIPSILIAKEDGARLLQTVKGPDPVIIELAWDIPLNHFVTMDLWMSSASREDARFLETFKENAKQLDKNLHFVPHFHVFTMPQDYNDLCWDVTARFCAEDPDGSGPVTGRMVLREDVRQLCILETTGELVNEQMMRKHGSYHYSWWDYVTEFNSRCPVDGPDEDHRFGDKCAEQVLRGINGVNMEDVGRCISNKAESMLEHEKTNIAWSPRAIRINGWRYSGQLDPVLATRALCSGFVVQPPECKTLVEPRQIFGTPHVQSATVGWNMVAPALILAVSVPLITLYFYKRFMTKQMRGNVREEVMMEVRAQMDAYRQLPQ